MSQVPAPEVDGFEDELFAPLDLSTGPKHLADLPVETDEEEAPQLPSSQAPVAPTEEVGPEVFTYGDGSTLTVEQVPTGFKAVLNSGAGKPEIFYGTTRDEMFLKIAEGKVHATKKINELNKEVKLGKGRTQPVVQAPATVPQPSIRELSADDMVDIQTKLASNPSLAFETWFQKRTGLTVDQLVQVARDGQYARRELEMVAVAEQFVADTPEYDVSPNNYRAILAYIYNNKLGKVFQQTDSVDRVANEIYYAGHYTINDLTEAFEELTESGLLTVKQEAEVETPAVVPAAPAPAPPTNERIVRTVRRPRAGLGIRPAETTAGPEPQRSPSVDDLDSLTDKDVQDLFSGVRRERLKVRR